MVSHRVEGPRSMRRTVQKRRVSANHLADRNEMPAGSFQACSRTGSPGQKRPAPNGCCGRVRSLSSGLQRCGLLAVDAALVAQRQRPLAQLVVEQLVGLGAHADVGGAVHGQRGSRRRARRAGQTPRRWPSGFMRAPCGGRSWVGHQRGAGARRRGFRAAFCRRKKDGEAMSIQRRLAHHQFRNLHGAGSANLVPSVRHTRCALNIH